MIYFLKSKYVELFSIIKMLNVLNFVNCNSVIYITVTVQVCEIIRAHILKIISHMILALIVTVVLPARKKLRTSGPASKSASIQKMNVL